MVTCVPNYIASLPRLERKKLALCMTFWITKKSKLATNNILIMGKRELIWYQGREFCPVNNCLLFQRRLFLKKIIYKFWRKEFPASGSQFFLLKDSQILGSYFVLSKFIFLWKIIAKTSMCIHSPWKSSLSESCEKQVPIGNSELQWLLLERCVSVVMYFQLILSRPLNGFCLHVNCWYLWDWRFIPSYPLEIKVMDLELKHCVKISD